MVRDALNGGFVGGSDIGSAASAGRMDAVVMRMQPPFLLVQGFLPDGSGSGVNVPCTAPAGGMHSSGRITGAGAIGDDVSGPTSP